MSGNLELFPQEAADSARITLTEEYTVINGNHIKLSNGFFHWQKEAVTIKTKNILSVECQRMRNKRLLVIGLTLFGILLIMQGVFNWIGKGMKYKNALEGDTRAQWDVLVDVMGVAGDANGDYFSELFEGDALSWDEFNTIVKTMDKAIDAHEAYEKYTALREGTYSEIGGFDLFKNIALALLLFGSAAFMGRYALKPLSVLRIKAMGGDFAVETKCYDGGDIERITMLWQDVLAGTADL